MSLCLCKKGSVLCIQNLPILSSMSWIEYAIHRSFLGSKCLIEWCIEGGNFLKEVEFKLVCELMKNSRRSDRELARVLGVSQPTVSRMVRKLETEGVIKEYTMIPDFTKLGFEIMSIDFAKLKKPISEEELKEIRKQVRQTLLKEPESAIVGMTGMGFNADRVIVAFHEDYSTYTEALDKIKQHPLVEVEDVKSFLINLNDRSQYLPLTFSGLADYITYKKRHKSEVTHKDSDK